MLVPWRVSGIYCQLGDYMPWAQNRRSNQANWKGSSRKHWFTNKSWQPEGTAPHPNTTVSAGKFLRPYKEIMRGCWWLIIHYINKAIFLKGGIFEVPKSFVPAIIRSPYLHISAPYKKSDWKNYNDCTIIKAYINHLSYMYISLLPVITIRQSYLFIQHVHH